MRLSLTWQSRDLRDLDPLTALACQQATDHGIELRLLVTRPGVWRAMKVMGADLVVPVYQSLHEAFGRLRGARATGSAPALGIMTKKPEGSMLPARAPTPRQLGIDL